MSQLPFSAVLPAAGSSSRMEGKLKQLLPLLTESGELPAVRVTARNLLDSGPQDYRDLAQAADTLHGATGHLLQR